MISYCEINSKHLGIAAKYMKAGENRILFIKDIEVTNRKAEMLSINLTLNNETGKCGGIISLSEFESDGVSAMIGHTKELISKLIRNNPKIIPIHCN